MKYIPPAMALIGAIIFAVTGYFQRKADGVQPADDGDFMFLLGYVPGLGLFVAGLVIWALVGLVHLFSRY